MNRVGLQELSNTRIREAQVLLKAGEFSGAYYLAGYSVECALKACFAKSVKRYDFPDKNRAGKIFTHKLNELARLAGLDGDLVSVTQANPKFAGHWLHVCNWTEESRYSLHSEDEAKSFIDAIIGRKDGVLPWIKQRW